MAWFGLGAALAWNYLEHKRHRATICSTTRRYLPRPVSTAFLCAGSAALAVHVWRGYVDPDPS